MRQKISHALILRTRILLALNRSTKWEKNPSFCHLFLFIYLWFFVFFHLSGLSFVQYVTLFFLPAASVSSHHSASLISFCLCVFCSTHHKSIFLQCIHSPLYCLSLCYSVTTRTNTSYPSSFSGVTRRVLRSNASLQHNTKLGVRKTTVTPPLSHTQAGVSMSCLPEYPVLDPLLTYT